MKRVLPSPYLVGLIGAGIQASRTPSMHEHEAAQWGLHCEYRLIDLEKLSPRQCQVVELRYFGGLSVEETAENLKVSPDTVARDWRTAKAWLYQQLGPQ